MQTLPHEMTLFRCVPIAGKSTYQLRHVRPSVCPYISAGPHWKDFHEIM